MGTNTNNDSIISLDMQRINGIKKYLTVPTTEIPVGGAMVTPVVLTATFQKSLDTRAAVVTKRAELKAALADRASAESERRISDEGLKAYVLGRFGADTPAALDFGYSARKTGVKTAATKAQAAALNKATREARGTVGPKKKLKIKGTLPPVEAHAPPPSPPVVAPPVAVNGATHG
jgi:hypothetical protein